MIETALSKKAEAAVIAPPLGQLKTQKPGPLAAREDATALAVMPKVLTIPV